MRGCPSCTAWPLSTRRSMTLPDTRKPRLLWTRADTTPLNALWLNPADCARLSSAICGAVLGSCAEYDDVQAIRPIVPAQRAPVRMRVRTRNIGMLPGEKLGLNACTVFTSRRPEPGKCQPRPSPNRHAFARAGPGL